MNKVIKIFTGILVVMLPVGIIIMLSGEGGKQYLWTTNIFLGLQAAITFMFLKEAAETKSSVIFCALILILSFAAELIGVKTGFPFGAYSYTDVLRPALFGVPLAMPFTWFTIAVNVFLISRFILFDLNKFKIIIVSSFIILAIDFMLEPFASSVNGFWIWTGGKIPFQNYISWFVLGFIFSFLLERFIIWNRNFFENINFIAIPALIITLNVLQFIIVDLYYGHLAGVAAGVVLLVPFILLSIKFRTHEV